MAVYYRAERAPRRRRGPLHGDKDPCIRVGQRKGPGGFGNLDARRGLGGPCSATVEDNGMVALCVRKTMAPRGLLLQEGVGSIKPIPLWCSWLSRSAVNAFIDTERSPARFRSRGLSFSPFFLAASSPLNPPGTIDSSLQAFPSLSSISRPFSSRDHPSQKKKQGKRRSFPNPTCPILHDLNLHGWLSQSCHSPAILNQNSAQSVHLSCLPQYLCS